MAYVNGQVAVPAPDPALPPSFDVEGNSHRYRFLESNGGWVARYVPSHDSTSSRRPLPSEQAGGAGTTRTCVMPRCHSHAVRYLGSSSPLP